MRRERAPRSRQAAQVDQVLANLCVNAEDAIDGAGERNTLDPVSR